MPCVYKPDPRGKTYKKIDEKTLKIAFASIDNGMSYRVAHETYNIHYYVLYRHHKNRNLKRHGGQTALTKQEEDILVHQLIVCSDWGYPLDHLDVRMMIKNYLDRGRVLCNIDRLELIMPRYAVKGGEVTLKCDHSVRLEHLHKVEWKKGDDKLFMYVKGRTPPFKAWEIPGAKLNTRKSSEKQIHLTNLTFAAGGSYYCVVSMETPSIFTRDSDFKDLTIIDPQDDDPKITFKKDTYYIGEMLEANCTTAPSKPPPHITWLLNDVKVRDSFTKSFSNGIVHGHGYFETKASSIKQLSMEVSQLEDGKLRLTCMATIPGYVNNDSDYADIRNSTVYIEILEESPALPSPVEAASSATLLTLNCMLVVLFLWLF